jgi:hypothetical protein
MFTDAELEDAILRYLQSEVSVARTEAGTRDIISAKQQVFEIVSSVFFLRPESIFPLVWMASNKLRALVDEQLTDMEAIVAAAPRASATSQRITSTAELYNAEAALVSLTGAFEARQSGVGAGLGPATARFQASVDRFVRTELAKNTVVGGEVVKPGEQLRGEIAEHWSTARARHAEIANAMARIVDALGALARVRFPDAAVGALLARVHAGINVLLETMSGSGAAQYSREALLDLTAMRVLLERASRFRVPQRVKAPLTGDAAIGAFTVGTGYSASIKGSVAGPYYYGPGHVVTYSIGGSAAQITLPGHSAAELRSRVMNPYVPSPLGSACTLRVDGGAAQSVVTGAWTTGSDAAAALNAALEGVAVTWDSVTGQVVFRSERVSAGSSLQLVVGTDAETSFLSWWGGPAGAHGAAVTAEAVAGAFAGDSRLQASVARPYVLLAAAQPLRVTSGGEPLGLLGAEASPRSATFTAEADFAARGVLPGDYAHFDDSDTTYIVKDVTGGSLSFTESHAIGSHSYRVESRDVVDYGELSSGLGTAASTPAFLGLEAVDQVVGRLARGAHYATSLAEVLDGYVVVLRAVRGVCDAYEVPRDPSVEQVVRALSEHGYDRARDLFVALELEAFFALDNDGVSYQTHVSRAVANAVRVAAPVSKDARDPTATWRTVAVQAVSYDPTARGR